MRKIAVVYGGSSFHHTTYNEPKYRQYIEELIYLPDLAETSLDKYDVILFPSQLHMKLVVSVKEKIMEFANQVELLLHLVLNRWNGFQINDGKIASLISGGG